MEKTPLESKIDKPKMEKGKFKGKFREKSLDGEVVTARNWKEYSGDLKISPEFLKNKVILNLGSGYSNLRADLKKLGIEVKQLVELDKLFLSKEKRDNFIQADARNLPFKDKQFDIALAFWSTYQIPEESKKRVYRELFRVANFSHIAPVFGIDFEIIKNISDKEENVEIILCQPFGDQEISPITSEIDYDNLLKSLTPRERIVKPTTERITVLQKKDGKIFSSEGGSLIIVRSE